MSDKELTKDLRRLTVRGRGGVQQNSLLQAADKASFLSTRGEGSGVDSVAAGSGSGSSYVSPMTEESRTTVDQTLFDSTGIFSVTLAVPVTISMKDANSVPLVFVYDDPTV